MKSYVEIEESLKLKNSIFIDVRSPGEYKKDGIPGAINLPILNDAEREEIGILYKTEGSDVAKSRGFQLKTAEMADYLLKIEELSKQYDNVVIYCWRGGYRSGYVYDYLYSSNVSNIHKLTGGYRSYRKFITNKIESLSQQLRFVVLHGRTGVGKTEMLRDLRSRGASIINLELMASNAGSVFGNVFYPGEQPTQKQFESRLFSSLMEAKNGYVFIESESKRIGRIYIPDCIFKGMVNGDHILIETSLEVRVDQIKKDYIKAESSIDSILVALDLLRKKIGNEVINQMQKDVEDGRINRVIEVLMTDYYDPMYDNSIKKYEPYKSVIKYTDLNEAVKQIERIERNRNVS